MNDRHLYASDGPPTVITMTDDDIECPIDRRTINMVIEALVSVHFNTGYTQWREAIYQDRHKDYTITNEDGDKVSAGYCVDKWSLWLKRPLYYVAQAPDYRSGLLNMVEDKISQHIRESRMYREVIENKGEEEE